MKTDLAQEKENRKSERSSLEQRIQQLENERNALEQENNSIKLEIDKLTKEKSLLSQNLELAEKSHVEVQAQLRDSMKQVEKEYDQLNNKLKEFQDKNTDLQNEIQKLKQDLQNEASRKSELESQISQLKEDLAQSDRKLVSKDTEIADIRKQLNAKDLELKELQESLKMLSATKIEKEERLEAVSEELANTQKIVNDREKEIIKLNGDIEKLVVERQHLIEERISLKESIEALKDTKSNESQILIQRYEEIIKMNQRVTEDKDKTINNLNQEIGKLKESLSSKERDFQIRIDEVNQQVAHLKGVNEFLQRQSEEIKKDFSQKLEISSNEISRLKQLQDIAQMIFHDFENACKESASAAMNKLRDRTRELLHKEDELANILKEKEDMKSKANDMAKTIETQKIQLEKLQSVVEEKLSILSPGKMQEINDLLMSPTEISSDRFSERIQNEIEKNLTIEKRLQYKGVVWDIIANNATERLRHKYYIKLEEEIEMSPLVREMKA